MRIRILFLIMILSVVFSCKTSRKANIISSPGQLKADEYVINPEQDTTLVTRNGAYIEIPKGSIDAGTSNSIILEIKEAYSLEQMIRSGLTTTANGALLSSGGMIYINAKGGENIRIRQALRISTPSDYLNDSMKLFKGEVGTDGKMNWKDPKDLEQSPDLSIIKKGAALFNNKCGNCHSLGKDGAYPDLAHYLKRFSGDTQFVRAYSFHLPHWHWRKSDTLHKETDLDLRIDHMSEDLLGNQWTYVCNLFEKHKTIGPQFPDLDYENISAIYKYIENESNRNEFAVPSNELSDCVDSCDSYQKLTRHLRRQREKIVEEKNKLENDYIPMVEEKKDSNPQPSGILPSEPWDEIQTSNNSVTLTQYGSGYYQFTIETFGWYNIDVLVKGLNGVEESELFVRLTGTYKEKVQVFLIIPSVKVYAAGGPADRNPAEDFAFQYKNGKIDLPQGAKAYIMALSETKSKIYYALKEFQAGLRQEISIELEETTKEEFNAIVSKIGGNDIKISVKKSPKAEPLFKASKDLEEIEKELKKSEELKPKNCDCDCGYEGNPTNNPYY